MLNVLLPFSEDKSNDFISSGYEGNCWADQSGSNKKLHVLANTFPCRFKKPSLRISFKY
jgi:hypothetical protein